MAALALPPTCAREPATPGYERRRPEATLLWQLVEAHWPRFLEAAAEEGKALPRYVLDEVEAYGKCGRLEHGFARLQCAACHHEVQVAFSCKRRGFCSSCGVRRMHTTAAHLAAEMLPDVPVRQWVLSRRSSCAGCWLGNRTC